MPIFRRRLPPPDAATLAEAVAAELVKAAGQGMASVAATQGATLTNGQAALARLQARSQVALGHSANELPRTEVESPFGPMVPAVPAPIDPVRPSSGRAEPRRYQYPVGWNLPGQETPPVPWRLLRDFADKVDIARQCIRVRKNELVSLEWDVTLSERATARLMRQAGGDNQLQAARDLRESYADEIDRVRAFWEYPDRKNGLTFADWLALVLEEHFVLDALSIYPEMTLGGELNRLRIIDGSTIKPLLDNLGETPAAPAPAYQQILHGFPRGEFTATDGVDPGSEFTADRLIYKPRYQRTTTPYGFSNTEEAIVTGTIYIARQTWVRNEFDEGVTPEALMKVVNGSMQPEQWQEWSNQFNATMSGETAQRMRWPIVPPGFEPMFPPQFAEKYKPEFDEHLIKLMCSCYDVLPTELGFSQKGGLGGGGVQSGEENATYRRALRPTTQWLSSLCNEISWNFLGMSRELTFTFLGLEAEDEDLAQKVLESELRTAQKTLNEVRGEKGLSLYDLDLANYPMLSTQRETIFLTPDGPVLVSGTTPGLVDITQTANPPPADPVEVATAVAQAKAGSDAPTGRQRELNRFVDIAERRIAKGQWREFEFFANDADTAARLNRYGEAGDLDAIKAAVADTTQTEGAKS